MAWGRTLRIRGSCSIILLQFARADSVKNSSISVEFISFPSKYDRSEATHMCHDPVIHAPLKGRRKDDLDFACRILFELLNLLKPISTWQLGPQTTLHEASGVAKLNNYHRIELLSHQSPFYFI